MTTKDLADIVAKLKQKQAELGDPRDVLNTPRAQEAFYNKQMLFIRTISGLLNADLERPQAELAECERQRALVVAAQGAIEKQIAEAPDYRSLGDARDRDKEWGRQQALEQALKALARGVDYYDGVPAVPKVLADLLGGETIEHDGRHVRPWFGCLPEIEERIAELTKRIAWLRETVDGHLKAATELLGEKVVV